MVDIAVKEITDLVERNQATDFSDLDHQEKAFAYALIGNGYNHRKAATEVGIAPNSALAVMRRPLVSAFISHLQQEMNVSDMITRDFVVAGYMNLLDIAMGGQEVPLVTGGGVSFEACKFMPELASKCIDKLSVLVPEFKDKSATSGGVNITLNFDAVRTSPPPEIVVNG